MGRKGRTNETPFAKWLFQQRTKRGWTLDKTVSELKVGKATLTRLEQGKNVPTSQTLHKLASAFEVEYEFLYNLCYPQKAFSKTDANLTMIRKWLEDTTEAPYGVIDAAIHQLDYVLATYGKAIY